MFNILNGGKHAVDSTDFQEFMVMPTGAPTFSEALRAGAEILAALRRCSTTEGTRPARATRAALRRRCRRTRQRSRSCSRPSNAGYRPGEDVVIALDPATTNLVEGTGSGDERRRLPPGERRADARHGRDGRLLGGWLAKYPIRSLEDGIAEDDWVGWRAQRAVRRSRPARR